MARLDEKIMGQKTIDLAKELTIDNLYRNVAWLSLILWLGAAFFISLMIADFDIQKVLQGQFWIDFSFTFGGGLFLKYMFGKYGDFEGHKHEKVIAAQRAIEQDNYLIEKNNWMSDLSDTILEFNRKRKLVQIRRKVHIKLNTFWSFKKRWIREKEAIKIYEDYIETRDEELLNKLYEMNFDLDAYKISYPKLNESSLRTAFATKTNDNTEYSYNTIKNLFGGLINQIIGILVSVVLAATTVDPKAISMATVIVFVTRFVLFVYNSLFGFTASKYAVETTKLDVLNNIHIFLGTFIELMKEKEGGQNATITSK